MAEERLHHSEEVGGLLDHRPVTAAADDMQPAVGQQVDQGPGGRPPRDDAVVVTVDHQHRLRDRVQLGPNRYARNVKRVTMPKLPPPPRMAQNRSGCSSAETSIVSPLASTTSSDTNWSQVSPCLRENQPIPPPSAKPPTPVSDMMPAGTTRPWGAVAASTSPSRQPPLTCTSRRSASSGAMLSPLKPAASCSAMRSRIASSMSARTVAVASEDGFDDM